MLGSQQGCGVGRAGGVDQVLMSKLCHCNLLEKSPRFLFSQALKVNLSKEHCNCEFLFGSLFCFVVDAYHLEINFCISTVCIHTAGKDHSVCS